MLTYIFPLNFANNLQANTLGVLLLDRVANTANTKKLYNENVIMCQTPHYYFLLFMVILRS